MIRLLSVVLISTVSLDGMHGHHHHHHHRTMPTVPENVTINILDRGGLPIIPSIVPSPPPIERQTTSGSTKIKIAMIAGASAVVSAGITAVITISLSSGKC